MFDHISDQLNASTCLAVRAPPRLSTIIAAIIMTIFVVFGILGNGWILCTFYHSKKLRQNLINLLIMSLCVNDIINLTLIQTVVISSYYLNRWVMGATMCYLVPELNMILVGVSLWHHAFIAFHRYLVVVQWMYYIKMSKYVYIRVVILGSRVLPIVLSTCSNIVSYTYFVPNYHASHGDEAHEGENHGGGSHGDENHGGEIHGGGIQQNGTHSHSSASIFGSWHHWQKFFQYIMFYSPYLLRCLYRQNESLRIVAVLSLLVLLPCMLVFIFFTLIYCHVRRKRVSMAKKLSNLTSKPTDSVNETKEQVGS